MGEVISYISAALFSALLIGSVVMVIYLIERKISKKDIHKKTIFKIYLINFAIWGGLFALVSLPKLPQEYQSGLIGFLVLAGIFFALIKSAQVRRNPPGKIKETKCTCQACGNIWYYGKGEYLENMGKRMINSSNQRSGCSKDLLCCSGCIPAIFIPQAPQMPVKEFDKCPKCNSSAIKKEEVVHDISR